MELVVDFLLAMFSLERSLAERAYRGFMQDQEPEEMDNFYAKKHLSSILGGEDFKDWLKDNFRHLRFNREIPEFKTCRDRRSIEGACLQGLWC